MFFRFALGVYHGNVTKHKENKAFWASAEIAGRLAISARAPAISARAPAISARTPAISARALKPMNYKGFRHSASDGVMFL